MAMKLDMSKTYDKVECNFLTKTMENMGFGDKLVSLIFECISTVLSYFVLVNGGT